MTTYIERAIAAKGGLARTRELLSAGIDWESLRMGADYGSLVKVRKGWWAARTTSDLAIEARRGGGRLACVSALEYHGVLSPSLESGNVHIEVPHGASRIVSKRGTDEVTVIHWTRGRSGGDNAAVSERAARSQAGECGNLGARAIALDGVQHR